ncbi:MAG TPA: BTAD domain-containing putative transcriptional regulator, partial [Gemmatimonadaceae bacterium]|nr:BTAD domain-containing putative transcriptional regulator [Gemmatimonadaceae bacterium]
YRGPLLDGFVLNEAPEFEHWTDRERQRLASLLGRSQEALAEAAEDDRDFQRSAEWWKKRAALDPYDSRVALRLMQALDATGNRAGAVQHATIHQRLIEQELGVTSAPEIAALADRLRREPAGAVPVAATRAESKSEPQQDFIVAPIESRSTRSRGWAWVAAIVFLAAGAFGAVALRMPRAADRERSIVVLPFINLSADPDNEYFSDGLTEEVITRLAAIPGLKVISRTSAMHYKGTTKPLRVIAEELDVGHVLEGSVRLSDGRVRISAQFIDARTDAHLWADNYEYTLADRFGVQAEIAQKVASTLEVELGENARVQLVRRGTRDVEAYDLYRRGRFLWNSRTRVGHEKAIEYYNQAIARDSSYADAYAGLADAYLTAYQLAYLPWEPSEFYARLKAAAERAVALDDNSADAHAAMAIALWWNKDWPGTEREIRRALQLNPGQANTRTWYGLLLAGWGRSREALAESRRAAELDPFAVVATNNVGWQCYLNGDAECAEKYFQRAVDMGGYANSHRGMAILYARKGMFKEAIASMRKAIELGPTQTELIADLAQVQALGGDTAGALATLELAKANPREPFNIGRAYVALQEPDSAFAWLERSSWQWPHRAVRTDPALDPIRSDPRFARLSGRIEREMGLR